MKSRNWGNEAMFLWNRTCKGRKELKEFWHFGQYVSEDSKYASEYLKMWKLRTPSLML
jgi:uncharacterized protein YlbG (UPF0298 family)